MLIGQRFIMNKGWDKLKNNKMTISDKGKDTGMKEELKFGRFHVNAPGDRGLYAKIRACGHFLYHRRDDHGSQHRILVRISENGGRIAQKDLTEMMKIRSASVSEIIGKIEAQGFVKREKNHEDRRNLDIFLTEKGKAEISGLEKQHRAKEKELFKCLTEDEKKHLSELLDKLLMSWDN